MALATVRLRFFPPLKPFLTICVVAGRTLLSSVISSLERITYDGDPLQFLLESTTYQPFISLFTQTEMIKNNPELKGIRACGSKLVYISGS